MKRIRMIGLCLVAAAVSLSASPIRAAACPSGVCAHDAGGGGPFVKQGEIRQGGGEVASVSSDGNRALVGSEHGDLVFTRSGKTWMQEGGKLTPSGGVGAGNFGAAALSADGKTVVIGRFNDSNRVGAVWVFSRSGAKWTQQGPKLTGGGEVGPGQFGISVAVSADGNTALIGANDDNHRVGAFWVFTRSGGTWSQQGSKLVGSGKVGAESSGGGVLSADGNTALVGSPGDNHALGAAWVFTRSGSVWTQQGAKLTGGEEVFGEDLNPVCAEFLSCNAVGFGGHLALAGNGNTALIGGVGDNGGIGAVWTFKRTGSSWAQYGNKLTQGGRTFGFFEALSTDGQVALLGDLKATSEFAPSGSSWVKKGPKLPGVGLAMSSDGNTALLGAPVAEGFGPVLVFTRSGGRPKPPCVVPKLKGKTLSQAKKSLAHTHCTLGRVAKPTKHKLVVVSQKPAAKKVSPNGARVSVRLG